MDVAAKVNIKLTGLGRFSKTIRQQLSGGTRSGPIGKMFKQWFAVYFGFLRTRFERMSKGGWPKLAESTILARIRRKSGRVRAQYRHGEIGQDEFEKKLKKAKASERRDRKKLDAGKYKVAILRDTGMLFNALAPTTGRPGQLNQSIPFGIRVGYGGPAKHKKGKSTIAQIAQGHQTGARHLPKRTIIVPPDDALVAKMRALAEAALKELRGGES